MFHTWVDFELTRNTPRLKTLCQFGCWFVDDFILIAHNQTDTWLMLLSFFKLRQPSFHAIPYSRA